MTKPKSPGTKGAPKPPRSFSSAEEKEFRRLLAVYGPISATDFDILCDLVTTRSRIELLRGMLVTESADAVPDTEAILKISRQIDSSTRLSMRLVERLQATSPA